MMAVAICYDEIANVACLYCTTSDTAFGPIFTGPAAGIDAEQFLKWLNEVGPTITNLPGPLIGRGNDAREWDTDTLGRLVRRWQELGAREPDGQRWEAGRWVPTDR